MAVANRPLAALRRDIAGHPASRRFHETRLLGYEHRLNDGFRGLFADEVLLVDASQDRALSGFLNFVRSCLEERQPSSPSASSGPRPPTSPSQTAATHIAIVAHAVATVLGPAGSPGDEALQERFSRRIRELRLPPQGELPIGLLFAGGVCEQSEGAGLVRHRAVLVKYVLDALGVQPCALVGGWPPTARDALPMAEAVVRVNSAWAQGWGMRLNCCDCPGALEMAPDLESRLKGEEGEWVEEGEEPAAEGADVRLPAQALGDMPSRSRHLVGAAARHEEAKAKVEAAEGSSSPALSQAAGLLSQAARELPLQMGSSAPLTYLSRRPLEQERRQLLAEAFPQIRAAKLVQAVLARTSAYGCHLRELVAVVPTDGTIMGGDGGIESFALELVTASCGVTLETISPSECVQFTFPEEPESWRIARLSREALQSYRATKLDVWRRLLFEGTCEAQLRRLLQIGPVTTLFDDHLFPTPEVWRPSFEVVDDRTGALHRVPHPVSRLRVWDPEALAYEELEARLDGAPPDMEVAAWWEGCLRSLRERMGKNYIDVMLDGGSVGGSGAASPEALSPGAAGLKKSTKRVSRACC